MNDRGRVTTRSVPVAPQDTPSDRPKVFCLGFNKSGTTSLHSVLGDQLGYRSRHDPKWTDWSTAQPERLDAFDAYSDGGCAAVHELDARFPGARFVLNTRPLERWVLSRHKSVERSRAAVRWALTKYVPLGWVAAGINRWLLRNDDGAMRRWISIRNAYHRHVMDFFDGRESDLLVLDIEAPEAFDRLADFLGVDAELTPRSDNKDGGESPARVIVDAIGGQRKDRADSEAEVGRFFRSHGLDEQRDCLTWFESDRFALGWSASDRVLVVLPFLRPAVRAAYRWFVARRIAARSFFAKWVIDFGIRFFRSERDLRYFTGVRRLGSGSQ